ncbi:hypothetical protein [Nocardia sp. NBC_00511]|uniref:hypothetical protein n=1 Tax=Nocardia sp. NBC_00511 TaxID=2903591 RepID=UPI0030E4764D
MRRMILSLTIAGAFVVGGAAGAHATAPRDSEATAFDPVTVTGNSAACFGTLAAEARPINSGLGGDVAARFDFAPTIPLVPQCAVPVTVFWQNLDTGDAGAVPHDIVPPNPLSFNTSHGGSSDYLYLATGKGRIALRMSTNPNPAEIVIDVRP